MLPDLSRLEYNQPLKGKAFTVEARSKGIGVSELRVTVDKDGWEACLACPEYRSCYDLSMVKLVLYRALLDTV
jgi:hypothetical protein